MAGHKNFLKDEDMSPLREFHAEQVRLAEEDIQRKLDLLERLGSAIVRAIKPGQAE